MFKSAEFKAVFNAAFNTAYLMDYLRENTIFVGAYDRLYERHANSTMALCEYVAQLAVALSEYETRLEYDDGGYDQVIEDIVRRMDIAAKNNFRLHHPDELVQLAVETCIADGTMQPKQKEIEE